MKPNPLSPGLQLSLTKENQNQKYEYLTLIFSSPAQPI